MHPLIWAFLIAFRGLTLWRVYGYTKETGKSFPRWALGAVVAPFITVFVLWYQKQPEAYRKFYLGIIGLCLVMYGNTLWNGYSMDDEIVTFNNERIHQGVSGIPTLWVTRYAQSGKANYEYRPVVLTAFAIEYELFGPDPAISHLINVLLYALTGIVIFHLLLQLFKQHHWILPLSVTVLFLIHPLHTEVVASLKNRDEMLAFLFALLSLKAMLRTAEKFRWEYLLWGLLAFIIALLAKKSVYTFAFIVPLTLFFFTKIRFRYSLGAFVFLMLGLWISLRFGREMVEGSTKVRDVLFFENPLFSGDHSFFELLPMGFYTVAYYIKLLLFPHPLVFYYGYDVVPIADWRNPVAIISMIVLVPATIWMVYKTLVPYFTTRVKNQNLLIYGGLYFLAAISMFSNVVVPAVGIVAERFAYLPSLGFFIVLVYGVSRLLKIDLSNTNKFPEISKTIRGVAVILMLICVTRVVVRNEVWDSHLSLYRNDMKYLEDSAKGNSLLSNTLAPQVYAATSKEEHDSLIAEIIYHFERTLEIYPDYIVTWNNLGTVYFQQFEIEKALAHFDRALELDTAYVEAYFNAAFSHEKFYQAYRNLEQTYTSVMNYNAMKMAELKVDSTENVRITEAIDRVIDTNLVRQVYDATAYGVYDQAMQYLQTESMRLTDEKRLELQQNVQRIIKNTVDGKITELCWNPYGEGLLGDLGIGTNDSVAAYVVYAMAQQVYGEMIRMNMESKRLELEEAIYYYKQTLVHDTTYFNSYEKLGAVYFQNQMWPEAIELYQMGIGQEKLKEKDQLWVNLGTVYDIVGDSATALNYYVTRFNLNEEVYAEQIQKYQEFTDISERWMPFATPWGKEAFRTEFSNKATVAKKTALEVNNRNINLGRHISQVYLSLGNPEQSAYYQTLVQQISTRY